MILLYPPVVLATIMGLSAENTTVSVPKWASYYVLYSTAAYPFIYLACSMLSWSMQKHNEPGMATKIQLLPFTIPVLLMLTVAIVYSI